MSASKVVLNILRICFTILVFILVFFGLVKLGLGAYDIGYRVFTETPVERGQGTDVVVEVTEGMSSVSLGNMLEEKGLIRDTYLFVIQMKLSSYADKIQPGLYTLNTTQTAQEMLEIMAAEPEGEEDEEADAE